LGAAIAIITRRVWSLKFLRDILRLLGNIFRLKSGASGFGFDAQFVKVFINKYVLLVWLHREVVFTFAVAIITIATFAVLMRWTLRDEIRLDSVILFVELFHSTLCKTSYIGVGVVC
jgi:hypothetical protein